MTSDFPDLPAFLDRRNGRRAVPATTSTQENTRMHLEDALAANTAALIAQTNAIRELTALMSKGLTATVTKAADAPEAAESTGKKSGKSKPAAETKPVVTYPEVSAAITQLAKEKGRDAAISVLKDFGVKNAKELEAGKFEAFVEAVKAALAADDEELA